MLFIYRQFVDLHFCYLHIYLCSLCVCVCFSAIFPFFIVGFCVHFEMDLGVYVAGGGWKIAKKRKKTNRKMTLLVINSYLLAFNYVVCVLCVQWNVLTCVRICTNLWANAYISADSFARFCCVCMDRWWWGGDNDDNDDDSCDDETYKKILVPTQLDTARIPEHLKYVYLYVVFSILVYYILNGFDFYSSRIIHLDIFQSQKIRLGNGQRQRCC